MSSASQKFVLVGPHAGKTITINGHQFEDGEYQFLGSTAQIATLTNIFSFYGAVTEEQAELMKLRGSKREPGRGRKELDEALNALPGEQNDPEYVVTSLTRHFGDLFTQDDEAKVRELVIKPQDQTQDPTPEATSVGSQSNDPAPPPPAPDKPTLAEAIGLLDPDNDAHWTSNNLPGLDDLEKLTGKKVARAEVEEIASGYTRAKARQAKAAFN
ncbi:hypothetical protein P9A47_gp31 [Xanthomonas phage Elanor]|uniref:Uncharacterized protein n=1 Tax=Xanthomonas phage Elanor TaxID=2939127 RepID=A0A9E7E1W7_9CAUD|nr:hypothetical protein P9A47_gp31 [Xanthomonas phage Elanor]URA06999.1 hypothetical protein Elanor_BL40031 [Xanthomonas phage Elanor]